MVPVLKLYWQAPLASLNAPLLAPCVDLIQLTFLRCLLQEEVKHPLIMLNDIIYITYAARLKWDLCRRISGGDVWCIQTNPTHSVCKSCLWFPAIATPHPGVLQVCQVLAPYVAGEDGYESPWFEEMVFSLDCTCFLTERKMAAVQTNKTSTCFVCAAGFSVLLLPYLDMAAGFCGDSWWHLADSRNKKQSYTQPQTQ